MKAKRCQFCATDAVWAVQWIAGEFSAQRLGWHERGFQVYPMCDEHMEQHRQTDIEAKAYEELHREEWQRRVAA